MLKKLLKLFGLITVSDLTTERNNHAKETNRLNAEIEKLENALEAATKPAEPTEKKPKTSYKVGIVEAKRRLKKRKLAMLRAELEKIPDGARGCGSCIVYQDREVKVVPYTTKREALKIVEDAEAGKLSIVF